MSRWTVMAIHIVIWVLYEQIEARVAAALAVGGRLANAAGNEDDIATAKGGE